MTLVSLSSLSARARPPELAVSWRQAEICNWGQFCRDVAAVSRRVAGCQRGVLSCRDSYWFAVGLFALMTAGAVVVLPPNTQPGTLAALAAEGATVVMDEGSGAIQGMAEGGGSWVANLITEQCRLEFLTSGSTGTPKRITRTLTEL
ncbi:MAG: hypothetical protein JO227_15520, partial [Acetobacteraceae bacterium]|nr:hypothetical protein [Acetobacteraceae bacterium]